MFKRLNSYILPFVLLLAASRVFAQGTALTYQGRLISSGNPSIGLFDMLFKLFDTDSVGTQIISRHKKVSCST